VATNLDPGARVFLLASLMALLILAAGFFGIHQAGQLSEEFARSGGEGTPLAASVLHHERTVRNATAGFTLLVFLVGMFMLLGVRRIDRERRESASQLGFMAVHDPLSGLYNRRHFLAQLEVAVAAAHRYEHPISLCLCDLDGFKRVNDTHGHRAGDEVIRQLGKLIRKEIRADDFAGRYGGDEFCIALNHATARTAGEVLERIRSSLSDLAFRDDRGSYFQVSATFGVAALDQERPSESVLMEAADEVLRRARQAGPNRVVIQEDPGAPGEPASA